MTNPDVKTIVLHRGEKNLVVLSFEDEHGAMDFMQYSAQNAKEALEEFIRGTENVFVFAVTPGVTLRVEAIDGTATSNPGQPEGQADPDNQG